MLDVSLLKDPVFMLIGISNVFGMAGLYVPFVYLVDAASLNVKQHFYTTTDSNSQFNNPIPFIHNIAGNSTKLSIILDIHHRYNEHVRPCILRIHCRFPKSRFIIAQ